MASDAELYPITGDYRRCAFCGDDFAPITSNAYNRYKFCTPDCEDDGAVRDEQ